MQSLAVAVQLLEPRYHGMGMWPPAPSRLFQALVAGVGLAGPAEVERCSGVFSWMEVLGPPTIFAPRAIRGQAFTFYVPNNQSDVTLGDPKKQRKARAGKRIHPWILVEDEPIRYVWPLNDGVAPDMLRRVRDVAGRLYQLGRSVDLARAWVELLDEEGLAHLASRPELQVFHPRNGGARSGEGVVFHVPVAGSFKSLVERHTAGRQRHVVVRGGRGSNFIAYRPAPLAIFHPQAYDATAERRLFEVLGAEDVGVFAPWPQEAVVALVEQVREGMIGRLRSALGAAGVGARSRLSSVLVEQAIRGARPGENRLIGGPDRVRIIPLPSIGHHHADRRIRRVLIEVPHGCPLESEDVYWAASALGLESPYGSSAVLVPARSDSDGGQLTHYGIGKGRARATWRSVTPLVLPRVRGTRRGARQRRVFEHRLAAALRKALRHAGVDAALLWARFQREPFRNNEARVEAFANGTRFRSDRLWHAEFALSRQVGGPLVLGDGRFLGLGLCAPSESPGGIWVLRVADEESLARDPVVLGRALRRAVMARYQAVSPHEGLPGWLTGHDDKGGRLRREDAGHVFFAVHRHAASLLVLAPHVVAHRPPSGEERQYAERLTVALASMGTLNSRLMGPIRIHLEHDATLAEPLLRTARTWVSATAYTVTRHHDVGDAWHAVAIDAQAECQRQGLPRPQVNVREVHAVPGHGLTASIVLRFSRAVQGPVLLGRTRHLGGGLFVPADAAEATP